jgi:uncharacterized protein YkwD
MRWTTLLAIALLAPASAAAVTTAPAATATLADPGVREVLRLVNQHRERIGCTPLRWDAALARVAERHSRDMARRGFFSHQNPEDQSPFDRMESAGIGYRAAAENIAMGQATGAEVFRDWMNSRGHRENMENCRYTEVGIGRAGDHWTLDLVQRADSPRHGSRRIRQAQHGPHTPRRAS